MLMKESLIGNCRTSLVVTIAEDAEMAGESVSSLRFGLSCGKISSQGKQQVTTDLGDEVQYLQSRLAQLNFQIDQLEASGASGGFNQGFPKPTRDGFLLNFKKL